MDGRNLQSERLCGFEIDRENEFRRLGDREVCNPCAAQIPYVPAMFNPLSSAPGQACEFGLEGLVRKHRDRLYSGGDGLGAQG